MKKPSITPNFTPAHNQKGVRTVEVVDGDNRYSQFQNWYVQDEDEHSANVQFHGSVHRMAEELETEEHWISNLIGDLIVRPINRESVIENLRKRRDSIKSTLYSAGYTDS